MDRNTYTVQIIDLDFNVIRQYKNLDKDTAEEKAETAFFGGYGSKVIDSEGNVVCEFEQ